MLTVARAKALRGTIEVPGDKSISHRALMISCLAKGRSEIHNFLRGEDCLRTMECMRSLGASIYELDGKIIVKPETLQEPSQVLEAGNSGTTMRLLSGILAGQTFLSIISGDSSLRQRPMNRIADPLRLMGASVDGRDKGRLAPLAIRGGNLRSISYSMPVASAQVKSAILLAGLFASGPTTVAESSPTRDHSEKMLQFFGADLVCKESGQIVVKPSALQGQVIRVPGDISSAAFFLAAAAAMPGSHLIVENVGLNPTRTGVLDVLQQMGADIVISNVTESGGELQGRVTVRGRTLRGTDIGGAIIPRLIDEIPILAVVAALAEGTTRITGAEELKVKESNRITAMVQRLAALGVKITELDDGMEIIGPTVLRGKTVTSEGDHRIAMAMAICGLFSQEPMQVEDSDCIQVSFPEFEGILRQLTYEESV